MATAPALIGDAINLKNIFATVMPTPVIKLAQTASLVVPFQKSPYKNGARNAPASAPQEIPISWAINVGGSKARITETAIKNTIRIRISKSCFFSLKFFAIFPLIKSSVNVELDVSTREDSVDIDAESTRITTIPISTSGRVESIAGIMAS